MSDFDSIDAPACFTHEHSGGEQVVSFRYESLFSNQIFLAVWLLIWGCVCLFLFVEGFASGSSVKRILLAGVVVGWLVGLYGIFYFPNVRKTFRFTENDLYTTTDLFGMTWRTTYNRCFVSAVFAVRPERGNAIGKRNWSVILVIQRAGPLDRFAHEKRETLLSGLTLSQCNWLATLVSNWSGVAVECRRGSRTIACTRVRESGGLEIENLSRVPGDA